MDYPFPYRHDEPLVITDLKNKLFANFYKFLTLPYNYYEPDYLDEYNRDDIRIANPRRESNKIEFDQAKELANDMVNDIRETFTHFKVATVPNAPYSQEAPDPIVWGPALPY